MPGHVHHHVRGHVLPVTVFSQAFCKGITLQNISISAIGAPDPSSAFSSFTADPGRHCSHAENTARLYHNAALILGCFLMRANGLVVPPVFAAGITALRRSL